MSREAVEQEQTLGCVHTFVQHFLLESAEIGIFWQSLKKVTP